MIRLLSAATANGQKVSTWFEQLALPYEVLQTKEQKQDWLLRLNLIGRIPVIADRASKDFIVFESGAILAQRAGRRLAPNARSRRRVGEVPLGAFQCMVECGGRRVDAPKSLVERDRAEAGCTGRVGGAYTSRDGLGSGEN